MGTMGNISESQTYARTLFTILALTALLGAQLVALGVGTAAANGNADKDTTCEDAGFPNANKVEGADGTISNGWGSASWGDDGTENDSHLLELDIKEGWQVDICVKTGDGVFEHLSLTSADEDLSFDKDISHVSWRKPRGPGAVTIAKVVTGDDVPAELDAFEFDLVCDESTINEQPITLDDGQEETVDDILDGSTCHVTETENHDATTSWEIADAGEDDDSGTQSASFEVSEGDDITVTFTNDYTEDVTPPAPGDGDVTVVKTVDGDAPTGTEDFGFELDCDAATDAFTLGDGDSETSTVADGATCTLEETDAQGADSTSWAITDAGDDSATGSGTQTTEFGVTEGDDITVTFTNTYLPVPGIGIVKSVPAQDGVDIDEDGTASVSLSEGDNTDITYAYEITNTGDDDLTALELTDNQIGDLTDAFVDAVGDTTFTAGDSVTVTAVHEDVTLADFGDAGILVNDADVQGTGIQSGTTVNDDDSASVSVTEVLAEVEVVEEEPEEEPEVEAEEDEVEVAAKVETLPRTGIDSADFLLLGLLFSILGAAGLLLSPNDRRGGPGPVMQA